MNLSICDRYTTEEQTRVLIVAHKMVAGNEMPLWYFKPLHHPAAWLSQADKKAVCEWARTEVVRIAAAEHQRPVVERR